MTSDQFQSIMHASLSNVHDDYKDYLDGLMIADFLPSRAPGYIVPGAYPSKLPPRMAYSYQPLPAGPWIRILRLESGNSGDPVKCSLRPTLLSDVVGQYDALSYTWGPESPTYSIQVDDREFKMRENLFKFLARLRSRSEALDLWADAICIDQNSTTEKNHQVQQMQMIYRNSRTMRLWLGLGDHRVDSPSNNTRWVGYSPVDVKISLDSILDDPYWKRLWIVQEVILSPNIQVYLPQRDFSWANLVHLCKQSNTIGEKFAQSTMLSLHRQRTYHPKAAFPALLRNYGACQCFDIRDRVFGLMGLVDDFTFQVDYKLSRTQLFEQLMRSYPTQFAEDLAVALWTALEMSSEIHLAFDTQASLTMPLRVQQCGSIIRKGRGLAWSQHPSQILLLHSYHHDVIEEGDTLYSLSKTPLAATPGAGRFLIMLQRQQSRIDSGEQSSNTREISYAVAGIALVLHAAEVKPFKTTREDHDRPLFGARTFRDAQSFGYSPLTMEIPMQDFVAIQSAYGFRHSDEPPTYDGNAYRESLSSTISIHNSKDNDDEDSAMATPIHQSNTIPVVHVNCT